MAATSVIKSSIGDSVGAAIPLCTPEIRGNEWSYVKDCLDTGWVSSVGAFVDRFEREFAAKVGTRFAIATVNGTSALHIALMLAGVKPDDEVLTSTLTFIAPTNAIRYLNAHPVLVDADAAYWQMDPALVEDFLKKECQWRDGALYNRTSGRRVSAVLPVHILGHAIDLDPVCEVARAFGLPVVEDATEGLGARYKGRMLGQAGDVACFSFNGNKLITTGGGGMIVTNDERIASRARHLTTQAKKDAIEFVHDEIGYNYRLTNLQAAVGVAQLEQLDAYISAKRTIAKRYQAGLRGMPGLTVMPEAAWNHSAFWMYTIQINGNEFGADSRSVLQQLNALRIQTRPLWQPMHLSIPHRNSQALQGSVAETLYRDGLCLPCSVGLSEQDQDRVIAAIGSIAGGKR